MRSWSTAGPPRSSAQFVPHGGQTTRHERPRIHQGRSFSAELTVSRMIYGCLLSQLATQKGGHIMRGPGGIVGLIIAIILIVILLRLLGLV